MLTIIAGSDTTSIALNAVIYYGNIHASTGRSRWRIPKWRRTSVHNEVEPWNSRMVACEWTEARGSELGNLTFAPTSRNETLRLQPPVLSGSQRTVCKDKGTKVCKSNVTWYLMNVTVPCTRKIIPEETQVPLHTYSIQRDPR